MNQKELKEKLVEEYQYPPVGADIIVEKIKRFSPAIKTAFDSWLETGQIPSLAREGYSIEKLISEFEMKPIAAFLTLDWIDRDPDNAVSSLKRGYDRIIPKKK